MRDIQGIGRQGGPRIELDIQGRGRQDRPRIEMGERHTRERETR